MPSEITQALKGQLEQLVDERDRLLEEFGYVFASYIFIEKAINDIRAATESLEKKSGMIQPSASKPGDIHDRWTVKVGNRQLTTNAPTFQSKAAAIIAARNMAVHGVRPSSGGLNPKKEEVAAKVVDYLKEADGPLPRAHIFRKLQEDGVTIHGKDPEMVLSTMLWRAGEEYGIYNVKGIGYWLESRRGEIENAFQ